jgi:ParB family chromosome partitioning protein
VEEKMTKYGLGKGLGALLDISDDEGKQGFFEMDIDRIERDVKQPRKTFSKEELDELTESIKEKGIITPILVRKTNDTYTIVAGERRFRAAKQAHLKTVPVIVKEFTDKEVLEISLIENIQREDLNPVEQAEAYKRLSDEFGATQDAIAKSIGKSRPVVTNKMRLLTLSEKIQDYLRKEQLTEGHARILLSIDENKRDEFATAVAENQLSVRELEALIKKAGKPEKGKKEIENEAEFVRVENKIEKKLATKVNITRSFKKGKITIEYYSLEGLNRIIDILCK